MEYEKPENAKIVFNPVENEINIDRILDYLGVNKIFPVH
jgi:bifunctional enzyme CysN/CysC